MIEQKYLLLKKTNCFPPDDNNINLVEIENLSKMNEITSYIESTNSEIKQIFHMQGKVSSFFPS